MSMRQDRGSFRIAGHVAYILPPKEASGPVALVDRGGVKYDQDDQ